MSGDVTIIFEGPVDFFGKRDNVESLLDEVMGHLTLYDVIDPSVSETYDDGDNVVIMEFVMEVDTAAPEDAIGLAMVAIRSAFHAAGLGTPGWDDLISHMRRTVSASTEGNQLTDA